MIFPHERGFSVSPGMATSVGMAKVGVERVLKGKVLRTLVCAQLCAQLGPVVRRLDSTIQR